MLQDFQLVGARVAGREHRKGVPRNCQDAFHFQRGSRAITAFVADGCGSGEDSEYGANGGVRKLSALIHRHLSSGRAFDVPGQRRIQQDLVNQIYNEVRDMGDSVSEVVNRYFLFTLVGVVITEELATFVSIGDGVVVINGKVNVIEPVDPDRNASLYLGYAVSGSELTNHNPELLQFQVIRELPTAELEHFVVGTDGLNDLINRANDPLPGKTEPLGPISQFWENDRYFNNAAALTLRLNLAARNWPVREPSGRYAMHGGLLGDDTTLVVGRFRPELS